MKRNDFRYCLLVILIAGAILGVANNANIEFFSNNQEKMFAHGMYVTDSQKRPIKPGIYPESVTRPPLAPPFGNRKLKKDMAAKKHPTRRAYIYKKTPIGSYEQITNNQLNYDCNGQSIPLDICEGLYEKEKIKTQVCSQNPKEGRRVNYFNY